MCGFVGGILRRDLSHEDVGAFAMAGRRLAHRGPDAEGLMALRDLRAVLAFRRLAIIDLAAGDQPMSTDQRQHIVFNGEIYNYRALRDRLAAHGVEFGTASDTEVLLRWLGHHGEREISALNGMFAFAYLDASSHTLLLARDRLGVKQLYYAETPIGFFFASEPKALLALPWVRAGLAQEQLPTYFALRCVPGRATLFSGIRRLEAGSLLTYDLRTRRTHVRRYWGPPVPCAPSTRLTVTRALDQFEATLLDAVRRRLVADVPVGAFLSGGLDSSLVVAAMRRAGHGTVRTFNAAFPGSPDDESRLAQRVAARFGAVHVSRPSTPDDFLAAFPRWVELNDDLVGDASSLPLLRVSETARAAGCTVMLSGEGADELFAGYGSYHKYVALHRLARWLPSSASRDWLVQAMTALRLVQPQDLPRVRAYFVRRTPYLGTAALGADDDLRPLLEPDVWASAGAPPHARGVSLAEIGAFDLETRIPDDLLVRTDRATMGASLEARVPFLDHELVEAVFRLPDGHRARLGVSKLLPRLLARRWGVPMSTIVHRKIGFQLPLGAWIRGPLRGFWRAVLDQRAVPGIRYEHVQLLYDAHVRGRGQFEEILWRVVALESWYRHHVTGDAAVTPTPTEDAIPCVS
jgi:asparagine synthase (glutamine-hydrolysing)